MEYSDYMGLEPTRQYADIIQLPRPASPLSQRRHPRMPLSDRAKIFMPFAALRGYDQAIEKETLRASSESKRILSESKKQQISDLLAQLQPKAPIRLTYFHTDNDYTAYISVTGEVVCVNGYARQLTLRLENAELLTISFEQIGELTLL